MSILGTAWTRGDYLSLAGLIVTILGFAIAVNQLARTARAAEATRDAVTDTSRTHLLLLLPQFKLHEFEMDHAVDNDDRTGAIRTLTSFAHLANEVAAVAGSHGLIDTTTQELLTTSASEAADAKSALVSSPTAKIAKTTKASRDGIAAVVAAMASIASKQQLALTAPNNRRMRRWTS